MRQAGAKCVRALRQAARRAGQLANTFPKLIECNICGWRGRQFENNPWHAHTICPRCGSAVRHRLLGAALLGDKPLTGCPTLAGSSVLHFAPEAALSTILRTRAARYVTADLSGGDVDLNADISDMATVTANEFDVVIACDVLEHVADDRKAMGEIFRILRPSGFAVLTVPQKDGLADTFEDRTIVEPADRERAFGQADHLRIYGDNFPRILESAGFAVTVITASSFPRETVKQHVLFPPVLSTHPLATNHRKLFVAQKA